MNLELVKKYNSLVSKNDIVIHLGDLSAGVKGRENELKEILKNLKGKKILLKGNHDKFSDDFYKSAGFEKIGPYLIQNRIFFNHYGFKSPKNFGEQEKHNYKIFKKEQNNINLLIHGHTHTHQIKSEINQYNVAIDINNYKPVLLDKILRKYECFHK